MTLNNFIPTVWAAAILKNLNNDHVYANCVNRDYEGDISGFGDTVKINSVSRPTIFSYTKNSDIPAVEELNDSDLMLTIDQAKGFNFAIDDIDKRQQKPKMMGDATEEAAWALADVVDLYLAVLLVAGVATANQMTAATIGFDAGATNPYDLMVDMDVQLTKQNVPRGMRWLVVPPWFEGSLRKDERFVSFGTTENRAQLRGKPVGEASGFTIWISNNVPVSGSAYTLVAGYKGAASYAEQIDKVEAYRPERRFADALKALHVYGAKVIRPYTLASCVVTAA